jgi:hypothetical protein
MCSKGNGYGSFTCAALKYGVGTAHANLTQAQSLTGCCGGALGQPLACSQALLPAPITHTYLRDEEASGSLVTVIRCRIPQRASV